MKNLYPAILLIGALWCTCTSAAELTELELEKINAVQLGLGGASLEATMAYAIKNGGKSPKGCYDLEKKLIAYGEVIELEGESFKCFKILLMGNESGSFVSVKLLKFCKSRSEHEKCKELDAELSAQLYNQL